MSNPNIWNFYSRPPKVSESAKGKHFTHNVHGTEVKVLGCHPFVDYMIGNEKEKLFGDLPAATIAILSFEILSGEGIGQTLCMASGNFFRQFSIKE